MAITKQPSGSWKVEIYRPNASRMRKTFKTREEARRYEKIFNGKILNKEKESKISLIYIVRPKGINISYNLKKIKNDLIKENILKVKKTENNFIYEECDAKDFFYFFLKKLKKNPFYFLSEKTVNFLNSKKIVNKGRVKIENFEKNNYDI